MKLFFTIRKMKMAMQYFQGRPLCPPNMGHHQKDENRLLFGDGPLSDMFYFPGWIKEVKQPH